MFILRKIAKLGCKTYMKFTTLCNEVRFIYSLKATISMYVNIAKQRVFEIPCLFSAVKFTSQEKCSTQRVVDNECEGRYLIIKTSIDDRTMRN